MVSSEDSTRESALREIQALLTGHLGEKGGLDKSWLRSRESSELGNWSVGSLLKQLHVDLL